MSNTCPNCQSEAVQYTTTTKDRRGTDLADVLRGVCTECGAGVRRDVDSGETVAFGGPTNRTEGESVKELRRLCGFDKTNFLFYCSECDETWEKPPDHEHDVEKIPNPEFHETHSFEAECGHEREIVLSDTELLESETVQSTRELDDGHEVGTVKCDSAHLSTIGEVMKHERETGHAVDVQVVAPEDSS